MIGRLRREALTAAALVMALTAPGRAQEVSVPPRTTLPFATEPDRLGGPPRAMGELPKGAGQPPSTLPGRVFGEPPRAMGEVPNYPRLSPAFGLGLTPPRFVPETPGAIDPLRGSSAPPSGSFLVPSLVPIPFRGPPPAAAENTLPPAIPGNVPDDASKPKPKPNAGPVLTLAEVLSSAEGRSPLFQAVLLERLAAEGELTSSRGSFDLNLNADSRNWGLGYYKRTVQDAFLEQPIASTGGKVFGGYRFASGFWPTYYNYLNTRGGGALVGGFEQPLLKNRAIDAKRAKLVQNEIERGKVEPTIVKERLALFKNASKAYWNWLASGRTYDVCRELVRTAESREAGLDRQAREGLVRPIDLVDFRKILLTRRQQEIVARRRFEQAAIEISLFLRDDLGNPMIPASARLPRGDLPTAAPDDSAAKLDEDVNVALRLRPEILSLRLLARKARIDKAFAENQMRPSLSLYVYAEQNFGNKRADLMKDDRPFILETSLLFDVPLQRRFAKGRVVAADASLRQIALQTRSTYERIRADVLDAQSSLRASYDQLLQAREGELVSRRLEEAERALLREGGSTILFLNLREQATSDAAIYRVEAEAKFFNAMTDYTASLGLGPWNDPAVTP